MASSRRRIATAAVGIRLRRALTSGVVVGVALLLATGAEGRSNRVASTEVTLQVLASPNGATVEVTPDLDGNHTCQDGFEVCTFRYSAPTTVTLTAEPNDASSHFYGWTAAECPNGVNPCQLALTGDDPDVSVFALYDPVGILVALAGPGTLKWSEGGVAKTCAGDPDPSITTTCDTGLLPARDPIVFTASPNVSSYAIDWAFSCESVPHDATECTTLPENRIVGIGFNGSVPDRPFDVSATLRVSKAGTGSGTVTGSGFDCGSGDSCRKDFAFGAAVTLQAEQAPGSHFDGWIGVCGTDPTCHFNVGPTTSVRARFTLGPPPPKLKVRIAGLVGHRAAGRWLVTARIASNKPIRVHARVGRRRRIWGDRTVNLHAGTHPLRVTLSKRARRGKCWFTLTARTAGGEVRTFPRQRVKLGR